MLALTGLVALFTAAGFAQRGDDADTWLPIAFGAIAILAYAGLTVIAADVMGANP